MDLFSNKRPNNRRVLYASLGMHASSDTDLAPSDQVFIRMHNVTGLSERKWHVIHFVADAIVHSWDIGFKRFYHYTEISLDR